MSNEEPQLTEEQIRQLEAELERITVDDLLLQTVVSLINLGGRKAGLGGPVPAPDWEQTRQAIEGVRALLPILESRHADKLGAIRQALSQLQMAYAQGAGGAGGAGGAEATEPPSKESPPKQPGGGRLWIPGQ